MSHFTQTTVWRLVIAITVTCFLTTADAQQNISIGLSVRQNLHDHWFGYDGENVTYSGMSWDNSNLIGHLPLLKPKTIRYPPVQNFWDWKVGWFANSPLTPAKYKNLVPQPDYLENFKNALDTCHAEAIFTLNLITATLQDQLAMLRHADSIGIDVKYVELGNEFYLEPNDPDVQEGIVIVDSIFPTPQSYGLVANKWIDSIHKYFPDAKVCVDGSYEKAGSGRRGIWNDSMRSVLSGREDAWSFHVYQASSWMDTTQTGNDLYSITMDEVPDWMYQPQKAQGTLEKSMAKMNSGKEAWITEYNLSDALRPVQGLWAHGLFNAALTLQYLQDSRITHITCYDVDGTALYGQYFIDSLGFVFTMDTLVQVQNPPASTPWGLTASGNTMKQLAQAFDTKDYYCGLTFNPNPQPMVVENFGRDTLFLNGLQGVLFVNELGSNAFIINVTGNTYQINSSAIFPAGSSYIMKYSNPLTRVANADSVQGLAGALPVILTIMPYSVVRITSSFIPSSAPVVNINSPDSVSICIGDSLLLNAGAGFTSYLWSTGETTKTIWAKAAGNYWVNVTSSKKAYAGADTVHVTMNVVPPKPNITRNGPLEFCAGNSVQLSLVNPIPDSVSYQWSTGATTSSITLTTSGEYAVTYTNEFGCQTNSNYQTVTVNPLPVPSITASGPTTFCDGGSVNLTAYPSGEFYMWSGGRTTQTITIDKSGNFYVLVYDSNSCKATSSTVAVTEILLPNPGITTTGPATYCQSQASTYLQTIVSGYSYNWLNGSSIISGATQQTYTPTSTGTYKAMITDVNGCSRTTLNGKTITINSSPLANISTSSQTNLCNGQTALLTANTGTGLYYHWQKNGVSIGWATSSTYTATKAGTYTCKVTQTGTACNTVSNAIIITSNCRMDDAPLTDNSQLTIYPNPASDAVNVQVDFGGNQNGVGWLEIRNALGQLIFKEQIEVNEGKSETSLKIGDRLAAGLYLITLRMDQKILTQELVVK